MIKSRLCDIMAKYAICSLYNIYPDVSGMALSGGCDRLVQPLCSLLGSVSNIGVGVLCFGPGVGIEFRHTSYF